MSTNVSNLFAFDRALPAPFDTLRSKKLSVSSKYGERDGGLPQPDPDGRSGKLPSGGSGGRCEKARRRAAACAFRRD